MFIDAGVRDKEVFLLDTSGATPTTHITSDPNFEPYIGVTILPVAISGIVVVGVGEQGAFDLYSVSTQSPLVTNLTMTAGNTTRPFVRGGLVPRNMSPTTSGDVLAEVALNTGGVELWRIGTGGRTQLAGGLTGSLRRGSGHGTPDYLVPSAAGEAYVSAGGAVTLRAPPGVALTTSVTAQNAAFRMFVASIAGSKALMFHLSGGYLFGVSVDASTREVVLTAAGGLALNGARLSYLSTRGSVALPSVAAHRFVLSGLATTQ